MILEKVLENFGNWNKLFQHYKNTKSQFSIIKEAKVLSGAFVSFGWFFAHAHML